MFVAAYWSQRYETKESAASRVASFLSASSKHGAEFSRWYSQGLSRAAALRTPLAIDAASIATQLTVNCRDADREQLPDLGFGFAAWNGSGASLSATVGCSNQFVQNTVVLDVGDDQFSRDWYRAVLKEMVRVFDPDHAVVTSDAHLDKTGAVNSWDVGWFTYRRGGTVEEHAFE